MSDVWQQEVQEIELRLQGLCRELQLYSSQSKHVDGAAKLARRACKELKFVQKLSAQISRSAQPDAACHSDYLPAFHEAGSAALQVDASHQDDAACESPDASANGAMISVFPDLIAEKLQGARNNLHGLRAELTIAQQAPGVIAVNKKLSKQVHSGPGKAEAAAEVDVIAQGGSIWIEVKCHENVNVRSASWTGGGTRKGIQQQAEQLMAVAQAPCNHVLWQPPSVLFHFMSHLDQGIAAELRAMGATVTGPGPLDAGLLPAAPLPPAATNLDVTTLCGLVSEASHCRHGDGSTVDAVQQWAACVSHWQECWEAELARPLLTELSFALTPERPLWASPAAMSQMQALVDTYAGPLEHARWVSLKQRLNTIPIEELASVLNPSPAANASLARHSVSNSESPIGATGRQDSSSSPCNQYSEPLGPAASASANQKTGFAKPDESPASSHSPDPAQPSDVEQFNAGRQGSSAAATAALERSHHDRPAVQVAEQPGHQVPEFITSCQDDVGAAESSHCQIWVPEEARPPLPPPSLANMPETDETGIASSFPDPQGAAYSSHWEADDRQSASRALPAAQSSTFQPHQLLREHGNSSEAADRDTGHLQAESSDASWLSQQLKRCEHAHGSHLSKAGDCSASGPSRLLQPSLAATCQQQAHMQRPATRPALAAVQARSRALEGRVGKAQREVLAVGDLAHALSLTANARAAHAVEAAGLHLPMVVHRAVWLTGL
ncbi:hypothetical protein WJX74_005807 [Apatococcus lobatus]|uniref:DUF5614 domain-containing protein n=1 Tax=Apatococcus lobatus TaxID=904363 RepID=A0AAW1RMX4_9CHLO